MDPDQALIDARDAALKMQEALDTGSTIPSEEAQDLVEKFQALDQWLSKGGFPPAPWAPCACVPEDKNKGDGSFTCGCPKHDPNTYSD